MNKSLKIPGLVFFSLIFLVVFTDRIFLPLYIHHNKEVVLPDVVSKKYDEAKAILNSMDLKIIIEDRKSDDKFPPDVVLVQNPKGNSIVRKGRRVYVTLSTPENPVLVPSLIGNSEREAKIKINNAGLIIGIIEKDFSSFYPIGVIINQSPLAGTKVAKGQDVNITVSLGKFPDEIIVPDIEGKNLEIVKDQIKKAGLKIGRIYTIANNDLLPNTILGIGYKNEPITPGTPLKPGDSIDIVISKIDTTITNIDSTIF